MRSMHGDDPSSVAPTKELTLREHHAQREARLREGLTRRIGSVTLFDMAVINQSPAGFPMAPSEEVWNALTAGERDQVVEALPGEVTDAEIAMPEGDRHFQAKTRALDVLRSHFARQRRRVYLAAELPI